MKRWNVEALRQHFREVIGLNDSKYDQRFHAQEASFRQRLEALEKSVTATFAAAQRAEDKADRALEKKFEGVNELRKMAEDFNAAAMPRGEAKVEFEQIRERLDRHERAIEDAMARGVGLRSGWGWAVAVFALALSIVSYFLRNPLRP